MYLLEPQVITGGLSSLDIWQMKDSLAIQISAWKEARLAGARRRALSVVATRLWNSVPREVLLTSLIVYLLGRF